jgi:hypothetical protein
MFSSYDAYRHPTMWSKQVGVAAAAFATEKPSDGVVDTHNNHGCCYFSADRGTVQSLPITMSLEG